MGHGICARGVARALFFRCSHFVQPKIPGKLIILIPISQGFKKNSDFLKNSEEKENSGIRQDLVPNVVKFNLIIIKFDLTLINQTDGSLRNSERIPGRFWERSRLLENFGNLEAIPENGSTVVFAENRNPSKMST